MADRRKDHEPSATAQAETGDDTGFLGRWSRRKQAEREALPDEAADADRLPVAGEGAEEAAEDEDALVRPEDLPDIESLDEHSDFTVFLKKGVPEALRRQALQRLWRSNPIFANLDGLAEYDEDYTLAASAVDKVKSLFQTGKGMRAGDEEEGDGDAGDDKEQVSAAAEDAARPREEDRDDRTEAAAEAQGSSAEAPDDRGGDAPASGDEASIAAAPEEEDPALPRPSPGSAARRRWGALES